MENKFEALINKEPAKWHADAKWRAENKEWLKNSQAIAIRVMAVLREKKINQNTLAEKMGVSPQQINKIVKGRENLTLQTIAKLERTLEISLMSISTHSRSTSILTESSFKSTVQRIRVYHELSKQLTTLEKISRSIIDVNYFEKSTSKIFITSQQNGIKKSLLTMVEEYVPAPNGGRIIKLSA